ncbi:MAG: hypothetical protein EBR02_09205 [Alphaproteobacteria bacterium]|nr:hypothetical protein [Alphaproteobacteria bacterium]
MPEIRLTRRKLVQMLALLGAGGATWRYWQHFAQDETVIKAPAAPADAEHPSLQIFAALCAMVTLRDDLDHETTKKMYDVFMDEPWGPQHIAGAYQKMYHALGGKKPATKLSDGESWFVSHLLTTWYLGIYYHEKRPTQRITYEHALMFNIIRELAPIPFIDSTGFGHWAHAPESAHG